MQDLRGPATVSEEFQADKSHWVNWEGRPNKERLIRKPGNLPGVMRILRVMAKFSSI